MAGNVRTVLKGVTDWVHESVKHTYLSSCSDIVEEEEWALAQCLLRLQVNFRSHYFLKNFATDQLQMLPSIVQQAVKGMLQPDYYQGSMIPAMHTVIHQILQCPYQGRIKRLYLEGKALELMIL